MENLTIEKFNPLKEKIISLVENVKNTVASASGATGYELMKENKKVLQTERGELLRYLKAEREGFIAGQKFVISLEKDLLKIIAEVEAPLDEKIKAIDEAKKREERKGLLPDRIEKLNSINYPVNEEWLLNMDEKQFADFFLTKKSEYLEEKQRKVDEENARIQKEKDDKVAEEKRLVDIETAKIEAAAEATKKAEAKAEADKQALIAEQNRKDNERIAAEEKSKKNEADKVAKEKEDQAKLEKKKKYIKFRVDNGYTEETKDDFLEQNVGDKIILFKKVGEFKF